MRASMEEKKCRRISEEVPRKQRKKNWEAEDKKQQQTGRSRRVEVPVSSPASHSDRLVRSSRQINGPLSPLQCSIRTTTTTSSSSILPPLNQPPPSLILTGHPSTGRLHPPTCTHTFFFFLPVKTNAAPGTKEEGESSRCSLAPALVCFGFFFLPFSSTAPILLSHLCSLHPSPPLHALTTCSPVSPS